MERKIYPELQTNKLECINNGPTENMKWFLTGDIYYDESGLGDVIRVGKISHDDLKFRFLGKNIDGCDAQGHPFLKDYGSANKENVNCYGYHKRDKPLNLDFIAIGVCPPKIDILFPNVLMKTNHFLGSENSNVFINLMNVKITQCKSKPSNPKGKFFNWNNC